MLQSKINTAEDDASRAALRSEAVNVLTMKLRLTINPSYLVRDESVLLQVKISQKHPHYAAYIHLMYSLYYVCTFNATRALTCHNL